MFFNLPRQHTQFVSLALVSSGVVLMVVHPASFFGVTLIGFACWVLMISDSFLHDKIQIEMGSALENLRKRQGEEIQDLLYFLRQSQIAAMPLESIEGAKKMCDYIKYPAMVLAPNYEVIKANQKMHDTLGYDKNELDGKPAYVINDAVAMSKIGEICSTPEYADKEAMTTHYLYVHKSGKKVFGQMDAHKINNEGFFVVFHPSHDNLISYEEIRKICN